jgi:dCTP deaminase
MTIMNESQILARLVHPDPEKRLTITPLIAPEEQFGPTSLDLRLGTDFQVMRRSNYTHVDPLADPVQLQQEMHELWEWVHVPVGEPFVLHPGEFALASTLEHIRIPLDLSARLEGRSTWGRLGLQIHATAGFVDPGFSGSLLPYAKKRFSKYSGRPSTASSAFYRDPEYARLRQALEGEGRRVSV